MKVLASTLTLVLASTLILVLASCRPSATSPTTARPYPNGLARPLWEAARDLAIKAEDAQDKQQKAALAQEGISSAESCIMKAPENAACYYYRAINTGLYYEAHVAGYQDGLKKMIKDCEKVIRLNEMFDHGGAYRILGKIYTDTPETTLDRRGVRRDTALAIGYLQKAVQIDPRYPENHIYLAEALLAAGRIEDAREATASANSLVPHWKNHRDYAMWQKANKRLSNKLK